jgi:hypothetical protein
MAGIPKSKTASTVSAIVVAGILGLLPCQRASAALLTTHINITGTINDQTIAATGTSTSDTLTGVADTTIVFSSIPLDFPVIAMGKSWKTKHHPDYAVASAGAANFLTLSPNGYGFDTVITYDFGRGALESIGTVVSTGVNSDSYSVDIHGSYLGALDAIGIQTQPALFSNVSGSPGDISMRDREIIQYGSGGALGLTETGTFSLLSGATLPVDPSYEIVDVLSVSFNPETSTLTLRTLATMVPEPSTLAVLISGSLVVCLLRRSRNKA